MLYKIIAFVPVFYAVIWWVLTYLYRRWF